MDEIEKIQTSSGQAISVIEIKNDIDFFGHLLFKKYDLKNTTINGNGNTLNLISITGAGLFNTLTNCNVNNLKLEGIVLTLKDSSYAGVLAGYIDSDTVIDNVTVDLATVYSDSNENVNIGGIVGLSNGTITNSKLLYSNIQGKYGAVGGIVGLSRGNIINCSVTGLTSISSNGYTGGIAGLSYGDIKNSNVDIALSVINGDYCGGIAGAAYGLVEDCSVKIQDITSKFASGGIVGILAKTNDSSAFINNCNVYIVASIESSGDDDDTGYVGGIAGSIDCGTVSNSTVNKHSILSTPEFYARMGAGGIAGSSSGVSNINDCEVSGMEINSEYGNAGGIVGHAINTKIKNCTSQNNSIFANDTTSTHVASGGVAGGIFGDVILEDIISKNNIIKGSIAGCIVVNASGINGMDTAKYLTASNNTLQGDYVSGGIFGSISDYIVEDIEINGTSNVIQSSKSGGWIFGVAYSTKLTKAEINLSKLSNVIATSLFGGSITGSSYNNSYDQIAIYSSSILNGTSNGAGGLIGYSSNDKLSNIYMSGSTNQSSIKRFINTIDYNEKSTLDNIISDISGYYSLGQSEGAELDINNSFYLSDGLVYDEYAKTYTGLKDTSTYNASWVAWTIQQGLMPKLKFIN
ncbi:MAG: GLUG motif-containing protein [Coprobacillaceae bacterium]